MGKAKNASINAITQGVIWKQIIIFFLPILVGAFLQQLYNTADAVVVGRFVGKAALSAVGGTTNVILNLIIGFFGGLASGATVIISQYFGAGDEGEVRRSVHTALALCLVGGVAVMTVGLVSAPWLLRWLNTPEDVMSYALPYLRIFFLGTIANLAYNIGSGILRAVGDSKSPLYVLIFCTVVNILLDLLFVAVLGMATAGAAVATILAQLFSGILVLGLVHRKGPAFRIAPKEVRLHPDLLRRIFHIGLPAGLQSVLYSLSNLIIQGSVNAFGTDIIASWTVFGKIDAVFWMVIDSFGIAVTTFIGQNYGAGKMARVKKGVKVCLVMGFVITFAISGLLYLFGGYVTVLFTDDLLVMEKATEIMQFQVLFFFTYVCIAVLSAALRAVGDSIIPTIMVCLGVCGVRTIWVLLIAPHLPRILQYTVCCYQISWAITSVLFVIYYLRFAPIRHRLRDISREEERLA